VELTGTAIVIACDSSGGIGSKPLDRLNVPGEIVGRMIAAVPLMEVMASGATPVAVINTLSVEMETTGISIINGIRQAVEEAGLPAAVINGSTEENIPTDQTGLGVTVIGTASPAELKLGSSRPGDLVYVLGKPLVGKEVLEFKEEAAQISTLRRLLTVPGVHEILPVGSRGILYELEQLAGPVELGTEIFATAGNLDLKKSAGPATCLLVSMEYAYQSCLKDFAVPVTLLARLTDSPNP
jgi:hypothetical protein